MRRIALGAVLVSAMLWLGCAAPAAPQVFPTPALASAPAEQQEPGVEPILATGQSPAPADAAPPPGGEHIRYVCLQDYGSTLKVRGAPAADGEVVGSMSHAQSVTIADIQGDWARLAGDTPRYVRADYLTQTPPPPLEPPLPQQGACIRVYKAQRELELWRDGELAGTYPIGLGFAPEGHKQREGDGKTPEGAYTLCVRNDSSSFYLSLGVSYPNAQDAAQGLQAGTITRQQHDDIVQRIQDGRRPPWDTPMGGAIMIHGHGAGSDWTLGCIAVENDVMDILWAACPMGTPIYIQP